MWTGIILGLLVILAVAFTLIYRRQRAQITDLETARARIQLEEKRVFDFLHGLGTALSEEAHPNDLHRLIVEGALRILNADGGALYLADRKTGQLRPTYVTKECPPLFDVPAQTAAAPETLFSSL